VAYREGFVDTEAIASWLAEGSKTFTKKAVVSGQWSVVSGQWSVVSGQWSVVSGQWNNN
jgi:hypothetical protein